MHISNQVLDFFEFVGVGIIIALIFDFFRSYRKLKKSSTSSVIFQDIIYFIILTFIIVISIINLLDSQIRLYIFIAILIGCLVYFSIISKYVMKINITFLKLLKNISKDIFLPIVIDIEFFEKSCKKIYIFLEKCCKKFFYMITYICKLFLKNKRGFKLMRKKVDNDNNVKNKKKKKKFSMVKLFAFAFSLYFVYTLVQQQVQINKYNSKIKMYQADIESKKNLVEYYKNQKSSIQTDEYIENVARENLGYVKPYEKIFVDANK